MDNIYKTFGNVKAGHISTVPVRPVGRWKLVYSYSGGEDVLISGSFPLCRWKKQIEIQCGKARCDLRIIST